MADPRSLGKEYLLEVPYTLPNLNDYINAERTSKYIAAQMKAESEQIIAWAINRCLKGVKITEPVYMEYLWVEPNKRRDKDNISSFGRKVIQDALVRAGVLQNDGWKAIVGFTDRFDVDKGNPRIEVVIKEVH